MEDGSSNLSVDSVHVLVFKVIWRDNHFLFCVILFIIDSVLGLFFLHWL